MDIAFLSSMITYLVFGLLGYVWASNRPLPGKLADWVLWLIALLIAGSIRADLVNILGFAIRSQDLLPGLVLGILINFILRLVRPKEAHEKMKP